MAGLGAIPTPGRAPSPQRGFDGNRTLPSGGGVLSNLLPPVTVPFEQLYRKQASNAMFSPDVSQVKHFTFEMGAYQVPANMTLLITDLRADLYRYSGVAVGDAVPVASRSLSNCLGFSLLVGQQTKGDITFELEPVPVVTQAQQAFPGTIGLPTTIQTAYGPVQGSFQADNLASFAVAQAGKFANAAGPGNAMQPQRPTRYGAANMPFTLYAYSGDVVQVKASIWKPLTLPIAFLEYSYSGILVPESQLREWCEGIKYPQKDADGIR